MDLVIPDTRTALNRFPPSTRMGVLPNDRIGIVPLAPVRFFCQSSRAAAFGRLISLPTRMFKRIGNLIRGFVGLFVFLYVILKPLILLPAEPGSEGLKAALLGILVLGSLSLSELFLPTTWMFFGIAYWKLDQLRLARQEANLRAAEAYRARFLTSRVPTKV